MHGAHSDASIVFYRAYRTTVALATAKDACARSSKLRLRAEKRTRSMYSNLMACIVWNATTNLCRSDRDDSATRMFFSRVPGTTSRKATMMVRHNLLQTM